MLQLRNVLLARDFSPTSERALCYAIDLVRRAGATLHLLYAQVLHEDPFGPDAPNRSGSPEDRIRERLRQDVDGMPLADKYPKLAMRDDVARDLAAAPAILNYAADYDVDLIVMGTHGRRGVRRLLLGSVAEEVVRRADPPVLTVRQREEDIRAVTPPSIERILVPVDFSYHAREALQHAYAVAELYDAEIDLLHVIEEHVHPAFYAEELDMAYDLLHRDEVRDRLHAFYREAILTANPEMGALPAVTGMEPHVASGRAASEIVQFAEERGSDLIVMSTHGLTGLDRLLMGSVAAETVRHVGVPVFTVKAFGKSLVAREAEARSTHQ